MEAYLELRNQLPGFEKPVSTEGIFYTFPRPNEKPVQLTNSTLNKLLKRIWKKVHPNNDISATLLRKTATTYTRAEFPGCREELSAHMCHAPSTADRYYQRFRRTETALPMAQLIQRALTKPKVIIHFHSFIGGEK